MDGQYQLVLGSIGRHHEPRVAGLCYVGIIAGDQQEALSVIAARGSDRVNESLVYIVSHCVALIFTEGARILGNILIV